MMRGPDDFPKHIEIDMPGEVIRAEWDSSSNETNGQNNLRAKHTKFFLLQGTKIQARKHFLTNQIRIITYLFWSLNIFLLISFWAIFLECSYVVFFLFCFVFCCCFFLQFGWKI